jgi:hypothetical protein
VIYQGTVNPRAVNFVENMSSWHQRNLLLFDPRYDKIVPIERCYFWWRANRRSETVIIAETAGQLKLVSGAYAWISHGAQNRDIDVKVYTQRHWPLPETLTLSSQSAELTLDDVEHSRNRFDHLEKSLRVNRNNCQIRVVYNNQGVKGMAKMGMGQQVKTVNWGYHAMDTLATVFTVADQIYS